MCIRARHCSGPHSDELLLALALRGDGVARGQLAARMSAAELARQTAALRKLFEPPSACLLYTSDAADERASVDLGGRRIIKKKKTTKKNN